MFKNMCKKMCKEMEMSMAKKVKKVKKVSERLIKQLWKDNRGFGIKEMAASLGFIVIVGLVITSMNSKMGGWLDDVWNLIKTFIQKNIGS